MSQHCGAALRVENIEVVYHHSVQVLRGLSLEVAAGAMVALLGSNGAGKTTTLKAVSGLLPLEKGEVRSGAIVVDDRRLNDVAPHLIARSGIAHVREGRHVFEDLSVEENLIAATLALKGRPDAGKPDFDRLWHYFPRLAERRRQRAGYLSGGEQQMLAISRALIGKPRLMLLDEPSLGLAPQVVEEIFDIIERINREEGVSMLLVEQTPSRPSTSAARPTSWKAARSWSAALSSACATTPMCSVFISGIPKTKRPSPAFGMSNTTSAARGGCLDRL
jgi:branched-chain amino acid transport system ATP-binding protein